MRKKFYREGQIETIESIWFFWEFLYLYHCWAIKIYEKLEILVYQYFNKEIEYRRI